MTNTDKLKVIDAIVSSAYEWQPDEKEIRGAFFEGVMDDECIYDYIAHWKYCPNCGAKMDGERKCEE